MNPKSRWLNALKPHRTPLIGLLVLPLLANAVALSGFFNTDPAIVLSGLGTGFRSGLLNGPEGWLDPSVGLISQPVGYLAAQDWLHGVVPWWNPYSGIGMPLAGEMEVAAFFLPFVLLFHFNTGWLVLRVLLQMLCGLFCYALFIEVGLRRRAAFFGAGLYALSPEFFLSPHAAIGPLPFLPLLLLGIERAAGAALLRQRMGWSLIAVAIAYSVYAGFPEVAYYDGLLAAVWTGWRLMTLPRAVWLGFTTRLGIGLAVGVALSAPQLVPFLEYLPAAYIGAHTGWFGSLHVPPALAALQLFPWLYGPFGAVPPSALIPELGGGCTRVPGWVGLPLVAMMLAAILRRRSMGGLRWALFGWVLLWTARYLGFAPAMAVLNAIPGAMATDSSRFSGPAVNFAVYALAAFGLDDLIRLGPFRRAHLAAILAVLAALTVAAILPDAGLMRQWYAARPADLVYAIAACLGMLATLGGWCWAIRFPGRHGWALGLLLAGPLCGLAAPQLSGLRNGKTDMAPIAYLKAHAGLDRMVSLGPMNENLPVRDRIASIDYLSLPAPLLWTDYVTDALFPDIVQVSGQAFYGGGPTQAAALSARRAAYAAVGVRYVLAYAGDSEMPGQESYSVTDSQLRNIAEALTPGGMVSGIIQNVPFHATSGMSVTVGTYRGASRGPMTAMLCAAAQCETATADAGTAADDAPLAFRFAKALSVPEGAVVNYRFTHPQGSTVAIWLAPDAGGDEKPTVQLTAANGGPQPVLVFRDAVAAIYELPQTAPYAQLTGDGCQLAVQDRQNMRSICTGPGVLMRRELYFPGWSAQVNGVRAPVAQAGLFQSVAVPAGMTVVRFTYAPPHIRLACVLALLALALWAGCALRGRFDPNDK